MARSAFPLGRVPNLIRRVRRNLIVLLFAPIYLIMVADSAVGGNAVRNPEIMALVIGVTEYEDGNLNYAVPNASRFVAAVTNTYPGAQIYFLPNEKANLTNVEKHLYEKIAAAPPNSLLIIYFAGHGVRVGAGQRLLLHGATQLNYWGNSLSVSEILEAVRSAGECTAMIFLDCCFSGGTPPELQIQDANQSYLDSRAFLLASSYTNEQSIGGIFTDALLEAWKEATNGPCLKPLDLEELVIKIVHDKSDGKMSAGLAFGEKIRRCFAQLNKPAAFLLFRFPNGCKYKLDFFFNDESAFEVFDPKDRVFYRQVPRNPIKVRIEGQGSNLWEHNFSLDEIKTNPVLTDIILTGDYAMATPAYTVESKVLTARAVEGYGADAPAIGKLYAEALKSSYALTPERSTSELVGKLSQYGTADPLVRVATGLGNDSDLTAVVAMQEKANVVDLVESVGKYRLAAEICDRASSNEQEFHRSGQFNMYKAALNYKVAGDSESSSSIIRNLKYRNLSEAQSKSLDWISGTESNDLRRSFAVLPTSVETWQGLGTNISTKFVLVNGSTITNVTHSWTNDRISTAEATESEESSSWFSRVFRW